MIICPQCKKENPYADEDGYTDEAPREYHAACWRALTAAAWTPQDYYALPAPRPAATIATCIRCGDEVVCRDTDDGCEPEPGECARCGAETWQFRSA